MSYFISSEIKGIYVDVMGKLRSDIGRDVTLNFDGTQIDCPNCGYDSVKKRSTGKYSPTIPYPSGITGPTDFVTAGMRECPICAGVGKITTAALVRKAKCIISQLSAEDAEKTVLGKKYKKNFELQTSINSKAWFETCKTAVVDGVPVKIESVDSVGIGNLSQIIILAGGG